MVDADMLSSLFSCSVMLKQQQLLGRTGCQGELRLEGEGKGKGSDSGKESQGLMNETPSNADSSPIFSARLRRACVNSVGS